MQVTKPSAGYIFLFKSGSGEGLWLQLRDGFFDLLGQAPVHDSENLRLLMHKNGFGKRWTRLESEIAQLPQGKFVSIDYE